MVEEQAGRLRIAIADRGPGIPPQERLNLFQRFVRLDAQDSEEYGIGLGLYVVKTTIEAHGGQVGIAIVQVAVRFFGLSCRLPTTAP